METTMKRRQQKKQVVPGENARKPTQPCEATQLLSGQPPPTPTRLWGSIWLSNEEKQEL